jgi:hypothetical protein
MTERIEQRGPGRRVVIEARPSRYGGTYERQTLEIKCCGRWLRCDAFTNTCPACGADYNTTGSRLAPREQWGEETGEHWTDCV